MDGLGGAVFGGEAGGIDEESRALLADTPDHAEPETEPEAPKQEELPTEPEVPEWQQVAESETEPEAPEEEAEEEVAEEPRKKYLGQFDDPDQLEAYALTLRQAESRRGNEIHQLRTEIEKRDELLQKTAQFFQQNPQVLQALQQPQAPPMEDFDPTDPVQVQQYVQAEAQRQAQAIAEQKLGEFQSQFEQRATQQQQAERQQRWMREVDAFSSQHPDLAEGTPINTRVAELVKNYMDEVDDFDINQETLSATYELAKDPSLYAIHEELSLAPSRESLDIVREAAQNPKLYETYRAMPQLLDTPAGIEWARKHAQSVSLEQVTTAQQRASQAQRQQAADALRAATVETGGNGAPVSGAPGDRPRDEIDEMVASDPRLRGGSIFTRS